MLKVTRSYHELRAMPFMIVAALCATVIGASVLPSSAKELLLKVGDLQVPAGTAVDGDVIAVGGTAYVDGTVAGEAVAVGGSVEVRGHVVGSVRAAGGNVVLRSTAVVDGEATAVGGVVVREPGATVGGRRSIPPPPALPPVPFPIPPGNEGPYATAPWWLPGMFAGALLFFKSLFWIAHLVLLMTFVGTAWLLAALFPRALSRLAAVLERDPVLSFGAGLLGWPLAVMIAIVLIVSIIGITLVLLLPVALFAAVQFGMTAVALLVGRWIRPSGPVLEVIIGAVLLAVVFSIPGFGGLLGFAVATWGLGAVILLFVEERRFRQPPGPQVSSPHDTRGPTATA